MVVIDLLVENGVEIGANYNASFQLCNAPDITGYTGYCQIRTNNTSSEIVISPTVDVITKDTFTIKIAYDDYPVDLLPGNYQYDVLFSKNDDTDRFFAVGGKIQVIKRITTI